VHKFIAELRFPFLQRWKLPSEKTRKCQRPNLYKREKPGRYSEENFWNKYFHRFELVFSFPSRSSVNSFPLSAMRQTEERQKSANNWKNFKIRGVVGRRPITADCQNSSKLSRSAVYSTRNIIKRHTEKTNLLKYLKFN